jgi:hypothetical protein
MSVRVKRQNLFNKQFLAPVVWFWGRSMMKPNPERAVEIAEHIFLIQNFMAVSTAQRPNIYLLPFGRYFVMKTRKIGKFRIHPLRKTCSLTVNKCLAAAKFFRIAIASLTKCLPFGAKRKMFSHKYPEVIFGLRMKERKERGAVEHPSQSHLLPPLFLCCSLTRAHIYFLCFLTDRSLNRFESNNLETDNIFNCMSFFFSTELFLHIDVMKLIWYIVITKFC